MTVVGVHKAKTHLSALLRRVAGGESIEIHSGGRPVARLVPITEPSRRILGIDVAVFTVPDDFNAPSPTHMRSGWHRCRAITQIRVTGC